MAHQTRIASIERGIERVVRCAVSGSELDAGCRRLRRRARPRRMHAAQEPAHEVLNAEQASNDQKEEDYHVEENS